MNIGNRATPGNRDNQGSLPRRLRKTSVIPSNIGHDADVNRGPRKWSSPPRPYESIGP